MDVVAAERAALGAALAAAARSVQDRVDAPLTRRLGAGDALRLHADAVAQSLLRRMERHQLELSDQDISAQAAMVALRGLRYGVRLLRSLDHALELLQRPEQELGLGTLYLLGDLAGRLMEGGVDLLESPSDAPDFGVRTSPLSLIYTAPVPVGPMPVELLFPRREAGNTLILAPLLVHELGHPICTRHHLLDRLAASLLEDAGWKAFIGADDSSTDGEQSPRRDTSALERFGGIFEECLCDALAGATLGPSYLLAFASWAGLDVRNDDSESHPPTSLRMAFLLDQLIDAGWDLEFFGELSTWIEQLRTDLTVHGEAKVRADAVAAAAPAIRAVAIEHVASRAMLLEPAIYLEHVAAGLEHSFDQDILPAQLDHNGTYAERRCVLLAAWKHALAVRCDERSSKVATRGPYPSDLVSCISDLGSNSLLDKALEMSAVLQRWTEAAA